MIAIPKNFPYHDLPPYSYEPLTVLKSFSGAQLKRVDFPGTALLLSATVFLVAAFEEAGLEYGCKSAFIVTALVLSGLSWASFFLWLRNLTRVAGISEPVFPWRFMQSRVRIGLLLSPCDLFYTPEAETYAHRGLGIYF